MGDIQQYKEKLWFPLESNPALLNEYISNLGFSTDSHQFVDVFSTESWALDMIAQPVVAVVALFPMTEKVSKRRKELHAESVSGVSLAVGGDTNVDGVWYVKQRIRNACGTIAVLHALANIPQSTQEVIKCPSWLQTYLLSSPTSSSPIDKADVLENDATIELFHEAATNHTINSTSRGNKKDEIDMHFITFTHVDGRLYELDGRLEQGPIDHGSTTQANLLKDACGVLQQLMEADLDEVRFTILALAPRSKAGG